MTRDGLLQAIADHLATVADVAMAQEDAEAVLWHPHLTERELQVLTCLAAGLTHREIGDHLSVTTPTVRTHVGHVVAALQCGNARGAAVYGLVSGRVAVADVLSLWRLWRPQFFV